MLFVLFWLTWHHIHMAFHLIRQEVRRPSHYLHHQGPTQKPSNHENVPNNDTDFLISPLINVTAGKYSMITNKQKFTYFNFPEVLSSSTKEPKSTKQYVSVSHESHSFNGMS